MCEASHAKQGAEPPCAGCQNEPPVADPANDLFEHLYGQAFHARDGVGALRYEVLAELMALQGVARVDRVDVLEKAVLVEQRVQQRQAERMEERIKTREKRTELQR